jgi:hypothetical protein
MTRAVNAPFAETEGLRLLQGPQLHHIINSIDIRPRLLYIIQLETHIDGKLAVIDPMNAANLESLGTATKLEQRGSDSFRGGHLREIASIQSYSAHSSPISKMAKKKDCPLWWDPEVQPWFGILRPRGNHVRVKITALGRASKMSSQYSERIERRTPVRIQKIRQRLNSPHFFIKSELLHWPTYCLFFFKISPESIGLFWELQQCLLQQFAIPSQYTQWNEIIFISMMPNSTLCHHCGALTENLSMGSSGGLLTDRALPPIPQLQFDLRESCLFTHS